MKALLTFAILLFVLFSCNIESGDCGDPKPVICALILVDQSDNILVGTTYQEDAISLFTPEQTIPLDIETGTIYFNFSTLIPLNNQHIMLKLSENETDTLNLFISTFSNECWSSQILDTLKYNGQVIAEWTGNTYKVIK